MNDVSPENKQNGHVAASEHSEQRCSTGFLQEVLQNINNILLGGRDIFAGGRDIFAGGRDTALNAMNNTFAASNPFGSSNLFPDISISNPNVERSAYVGDTGGRPSFAANTNVGDSGARQNFDPNANAGDSVGQTGLDPYSFGGDTGGQKNFDPYDYAGDTKGQQNVPPFDVPPEQNPPSTPPENPPSTPPDAPPATPPDAPPAGDQQTKMGDRMFTVHADGLAEYNVVSGDCVWFVATDVLKGRSGQNPNDAQIVAEVNAIAQASGLTQNGRNPDLIYPDDKLVIPAADKS